MSIFHIKCFSKVPYSSEQMFNLINDVTSYNQFIPGCSVIKILYQSDDEIIAEISFITNSVAESLITHNFFIKNKIIMIFLIESPFKYFYGCWNFTPINSVISCIEYVACYEFNSIVMEKIFNYFLQKICENIIKLFLSRAHQIYGFRDNVE